MTLQLSERDSITLRFAIGAPVECNCGDWKKGIVIKQFYVETKFPLGTCMPYQVMLDDGGLIWVPHDKDSVIRALKATTQQAATWAGTGLQNLPVDDAEFDRQVLLVRKEMERLQALERRGAVRKDEERLQRLEVRGGPPGFPLHTAVADRDVAKVLALLDAGVDLAAVNRMDQTAMELAIVAAVADPAKGAAMIKAMVASTKGRLDATANLIGGLISPSDTDGMTILHRAASQCDHAVVAALMSAFAGDEDLAAMVPNVINQKTILLGGLCVLCRITRPRTPCP